MKFLDFEKPIAEISNKIEELRLISSEGGVNIADEISRLQNKLERLFQQTYTQLSPWQKVQVARHIDRPKFSHYLNILIKDFVELSGDRLFAEDSAILGGLGVFEGHHVVVIGQEKGHDTESRVKHNFGMPKPEGYRKARRLMELADRFRLPILTFIDTPGAYPGIDAEERGQAEAIAQSIATCLRVQVPIISIVIGEGGSGGAIALATSNVILMLEHSIYSVISPEGCASILWKSATKAPDAADAQKLTAQDLFNLKLIDHVIREPVGGAHRYPKEALSYVKDALIHVLNGLPPSHTTNFAKLREEKFLAMGRDA